MLNYSHCDKASLIIRSFCQELPCHGHLSLYIKGWVGCFELMDLGLGKGQQTEAAVATRPPLLARTGKCEKMVQSCRYKCSACHLKDLQQRQKAKKLWQKKNRKTRYWCHFLIMKGASQTWRTVLLACRCSKMSCLSQSKALHLPSRDCLPTLLWLPFYLQKPSCPPVSHQSCKKNPEFLCSLLILFMVEPPSNLFIH